MDQLGIVRADFVCNSWGGSAALSLASKYPSRVRSVVVTGSMPIIHDALAPIPVRGQVGRMVRELYYGGEGPTYEKMRELIGRYEWYDASLVPDEVVRLRYEQSITPDERHLAAQPDSYRGTAEDLGACMRNIICPVLLLWGLHDAFVPPEYALMLTRLLSRAQLHILDAAGHHPQKERPLHYIEIVKSFLNQPETIQ